MTALHDLAGRCQNLGDMLRSEERLSDAGVAHEAAERLQALEAALDKMEAERDALLASVQTARDDGLEAAAAYVLRIGSYGCETAAAEIRTL